MEDRSALDRDLSGDLVAGRVDDIVSLDLHTSLKQVSQYLGHLRISFVAIGFGVRLPIHKLIAVASFPSRLTKKISSLKPSCFRAVDLDPLFNQTNDDTI